MRMDEGEVYVRKGGEAEVSVTAHLLIPARLSSLSPFCPLPAHTPWWQVLIGGPWTCIKLRGLSATPDGLRRAGASELGRGGGFVRTRGVKSGV